MINFSGLKIGGKNQTTHYSLMKPIDKGRLRIEALLRAEVVKRLRMVVRKIAGPGCCSPLSRSECHRVLKPGGILRVVVPDLERIARESIRNLERALASEEGAEF